VGAQGWRFRKLTKRGSPSCAKSMLEHCLQPRWEPKVRAQGRTPEWEHQVGAQDRSPSRFAKSELEQCLELRWEPKVRAQGGSSRLEIQEDHQRWEPKVGALSWSYKNYVNT